jgi:hypothetical protein
VVLACARAAAAAAVDLDDDALGRVGEAGGVGEFMGGYSVTLDMAAALPVLASPLVMFPLPIAAATAVRCECPVPFGVLFNGFCDACFM